MLGFAMVHRRRLELPQTQVRSLVLSPIELTVYIPAFVRFPRLQGLFRTSALYYWPPGGGLTRRHYAISPYVFEKCSCEMNNVNTLLEPPAEFESAACALLAEDP